MHRKTNRNNCRMIIPVLLFLFIYCFFILSCQEKKELQNLFDQSLEKFLKTDQELICFTKAGTIPLPFTSPGGIAAGPDGRIYATGDRKLIIFEEDGSLADQMELDEKAFALAVPAQTGIYLGYIDYVEKINLLTKERFKWAPLGNHALITSIAVNSHYIFVADAGNRAVLCYDKDGTLKKLITGEEETKEPHFIIPSPYFDVAAGVDDTFWVTNPGRYRVEHWSVKDGFLDQWGESGAEPDKFCGCCNPVHITLFPPDHGQHTTIVTAEKGIPRVKLYNNSGDFQCIAAPPELFKIGTKGLDLAAGTNGRVYVLDPGKKLIRIFESKGEKYGEE